MYHSLNYYLLSAFVLFFFYQITAHCFLTKQPVRLLNIQNGLPSPPKLFTWLPFYVLIWGFLQPGLKYLQVIHIVLKPVICTYITAEKQKQMWDCMKTWRQTCTVLFNVPDDMTSSACYVHMENITTVNWSVSNIPKINIFIKKRHTNSTDCIRLMRGRNRKEINIISLKHRSNAPNPLKMLTWWNFDKYVCVDARWHVSVFQLCAGCVWQRLNVSTDLLSEPSLFIQLCS